LKKNRKLELEKAVAAISEILEKHDLSGAVVLHIPGVTVSKVKIDPSWSCAKQVEDTVKIRAKLEDFNGDAVARKKKIDDTVNMLKTLRDEFVLTIYPYHEILERLVLKLEEANNQNP
jgi:hypothetical protein